MSLANGSCHLAYHNLWLDPHKVLAVWPPFGHRLRGTLFYKVYVQVPIFVVDHSCQADVHFLAVPHSHLVSLDIFFFFFFFIDQNFFTLHVLFK